MMLLGGRGVRKGGGEGMAKESPAISVIIPMYNVERYIIYCMESIMQQTFKDFEVIMIDDASTDNTYRVCQTLFGKDERVTILRNESNQGQCNSRNRGMKLARGKYLYFMDSDDEILPQGLEKLYRTAEEEKADVVHSNFYAMVCTQGRMRLRKSLWEGARCHDTGVGVLEGTLVERFNYQGMKSQPMPWLNLYNREFLLGEELFFPDLTISEDDMFSMAVIMKAKRYVRINEACYLYRQYGNDKERNAQRLPIAFQLMNKALLVIDDLFSHYSEDELPFRLRQEFKAGWMRAHIVPWVFKILDTKDKYGEEKIKSLLSAIVPQYVPLVSVFIYMLDNDAGLRIRIEQEAVQRRNFYQQKIHDFFKGQRENNYNYDWLYCQARLATLVEGGETTYYKEAYRYLALSAFRLGKYKEALDAYQKALQYTESYSPELLKIFDEYLYALHFQDFLVEDIAKVHRLYGEQFSSIEPYDYEADRKDQNKRKIRIGYISPYFCRNEFAGAYYGLLFAYDREKFEVYCYHTGNTQDDYTRAIKATVDKFIDMGHLNHKEMAETIHADEVDVLIDLMGHLPGNALSVLAYRPAPLQISGVGYPSTTGLGTVDYYLTDETIDPPEENDEFFTEKLLYLPCRFSFGRFDEIPLPPELPCLRHGYVTFGIFAPYYQLGEVMLSLWQKIMADLPGSQLLVRSDDFACEAMIAEATDRFADYGFDIKRVHFEAGTPWEGYRRVDIMLDTYPCPAGMKILEAIYMGVPVVALYGERRDTRLGLSILRSLGLEELAADNRAEYMQKLLALAGRQEELNRLHQNLRTMLKEAKVLNPVHYVHCLEKSIENILKKNL